MLVSIIIPILNELKYIDKVLTCILKQTYSHREIELIFTDGGSKDGTLDILNQFQEQYRNQFYDIRILNNIKKRQASGVNLGFENAKGDVLCRVDAHSIIPIGYIQCAVDILSKKNKIVCGGAYKQIIEKKNIIGNLYLLIESSMFGSGIASFRGEAKQEKEVNSIMNICMLQKTFQEIGKFNEKLVRSEDNDYSYRLRINGYKIILNPLMNGEYYIRSSFIGNLKQKYNNGKWIGITSRLLSFKMFSKYHFIPFLFFVSVVLLSLVACIGTPLTNNLWFLSPLGLELICYFLLMYLNVFLTSISMRKFNILFFIAPFLLFIIHFSYGMGTLQGFLSYRKYE